MEKTVSLQYIGKVIEGRQDAVDDYWGDERSIIELDSQLFDATSIDGLDTFSHVEVIFHFHLVLEKDILWSSSHPRGNPKWPKVGIFAQRKKDRPNRIGVSICKVDRVEGTKIWVSGLDAIKDTPILDIKPVIRGFLPEKTQIKEPEWASELMCAYYKNKDERK